MNELDLPGQPPSVRTRFWVEQLRANRGWGTVIAKAIEPLIEIAERFVDLSERVDRLEKERSGG